MYKHEEKYCPRCKARFECRVGDVANCQCNAVNITEETQRLLQNAYPDCLCSACLSAIDQMMKFSIHHQLPRQKELMIEGLHYYTEKGYFVFTELYHLQRGYCCRSGCRHCPYGFKKD